MYTTIKSVQYLIAMLKKKNISRCVISPGNSHNAIVRSIEEDNYFTTYNIVDERSAAYFAIGVIQEANEPVAIICTAGTAVSNYLAGITEASRRKLPLIAITADKNPYYLDQDEDQMINQKGIFGDLVKYSVSLPIIKDEADSWYCNRILNEAFLEMSHHGTGPIHVNVPIDDGKLAIGRFFGEKELPSINIIERLDEKTSKDIWINKIKSLKEKKVLIIYGQDENPPKEINLLIKELHKKYNCVVAVDKLSNIHGEGCLEISKAALRNKLSNNPELYPDVVISLAGNSVLDFKFKLKGTKLNFEHWLVSTEGKVIDPYRKLTTIFECSIIGFLTRLNDYSTQGQNNTNDYYKYWSKENKMFILPSFEYSNLYAVNELMKRLPNESILNLANSTTIRIAQYFDLDDTIKVYCNRGVNGIDGCMSTFIGQSSVTDKLSYLIIGDLTFFYDMNALWNNYVGNNVRILLNNNEGASLFHFNQGLKNYPTLNKNVAAEHFSSAKGWVEDQGFKYLSATNKDEFDIAVEEFLDKDSDKPIIFEVFTKKDEDARLQHDFYKLNTVMPEGKDAIKIGIKKAAKSILSPGMINRLKKL